VLKQAWSIKNYRYVRDVSVADAGTTKGEGAIRKAHARVSMDFVSQEHGVPHDGPKDSNAGAEHGRSWIVTKHGDRSLVSSNAQHTSERDAKLYPGSGPSW
jgi:hypothetical protein